MARKDNKEVKPSWIDPANDRKTPFTEEELDVFVSGFIDGHTEKWKELVDQFGKEQAWNKIKESFQKMDKNNILNMKVDDIFIN